MIHSSKDNNYVYCQSSKSHFFSITNQYFSSINMLNCHKTKTDFISLHVKCELFGQYITALSSIKMYVTSRLSTHHYDLDRGSAIEASAQSHDSPSNCCCSSSTHKQTEDDRNCENAATNSLTDRQPSLQTGAPGSRQRSTLLQIM